MILQIYRNILITEWNPNENKIFKKKIIVQPKQHNKTKHLKKAIGEVVRNEKKINRRKWYILQT